jgi:hypothetical protein
MFLQNNSIRKSLYRPLFRITDYNGLLQYGILANVYCVKKINVGFYQTVQHVR